MSRSASVDDAFVFRVVIERPRPEWAKPEYWRYPRAVGPYRTVGAAKAALKRESVVDRYGRPIPGLTARVEYAETTWREVPE